MERQITENELRAYKEAMVRDYAHLTKDPKRVEEFANSISFNMGSKYIRVVQKGSAHSFIVASRNHPNFMYGDILKSASWSQPAKNFRRGSIFNMPGRVPWTGW